MYLANGLNVAETRDQHYFQPPEYIVIEPEDTKGRTQNLQQSNVSGYKLQDVSSTLKENLQEFCDTRGLKELRSCDLETQSMLHELMGMGKYRLDTNFAKIDRIDHDGIEEFKTRILDSLIKNEKILSWTKTLKNLNSDSEAQRILAAGTILETFYADSAES